MQNNDNDWKLFSKWSIRKISFIGILIAISVVFLIIGSTLMPVVIIPSYKISFIGLPIKISGFIFGPIIGGLVGLISDLLSFMIIPSFYHPLYTLAAIVDGVVAGLVGVVFMKLLKYYFGGYFADSFYRSKILSLYKKWLEIKEGPAATYRKMIKLEEKIILYGEKRKKIKINGTQKNLLNVNLIFSISILALLGLFIFYLIGYKIDDQTIENGLIKNRWVMLGLMVSGYFSMLVFVIIARFKMKAKNYLVMVPIVIFSAFIELINVPILSLADTLTNTKGDSKDIFVFIFQHTVFSPIKIWFNMFIVLFTYNIVSPLINKNNKITY